MSDIMTVLSHRKEVSFDEMYRLLNQLVFVDAEESNKYALFRYMSKLESLGHVEIDYNDRKVYCNKTYLGMMPRIGLYQALLIGARNQNFLSKISSFINKHNKGMKMIISKQTHTGLPDLVIIESYSKSLISQFSENFGLTFTGFMPLAQQLVEESSTTRQYADEIQEMNSLNWPKRIFSLELLHFINQAVSGDNALEEYITPTNQQKIHRLVIGGHGYKVSADWGRYLYLENAELNVLLYDKVSLLLAVPRNVPLPKLLARAVSLCSGLTSEQAQISIHSINFPKDLWVDIYKGVPRYIAEQVAFKLNQTLQIIELNQAVKE